MISAFSSNVILDDANVKDSLSKYSGFVHMVNNASVSVNRLKFKYSKSRMQGSAFYIEGEGSTELKLLNCPEELEYFESILNGGFLYNSNPDLILNITDCKINHVFSNADGGLLYFESGSAIKINNLGIENITSIGDGGFLYSIFEGTVFNI